MSTTNARLSVRMPEDELKKLKEYAESKNKTLADWVRETLLVAADMQEDKILELEKRLDKLEQKVA